MKISQFRELFAPDQGQISIREKILSAMVAFLGIALVMAVSMIWLAPNELPWIVASMGASAVLLFAVPMGPLSQPWAFAGGHMISGAIGITIAMMLPGQILLAAALAVSLAVFAMYVTHSLHPPGGATALSAVMGGAHIHAMGYSYLLTPVLVNVTVMLIWALFINNLMPNRCYPSGLGAWRKRKNTVIGEDKADINIAIGREDLEFALREMDEFLDVSEDDLSKIFAISADHARRKRMGELLCGEIMTKEVIFASSGSNIEKIWNLMRKHRIR
ncbi:MAG TPA: HPP family protein, partial [Rhizobiales bacterium]|nr:HPP family protein [Hyphomicrobiales bacterium]